MVRRIPSRQRNAPLAREFDRSVLVRLALLLVCGLTLAGGFVYAGCQHFTALRFGYQTENLRKIRSELAEDQRRFLLEREAAASPARLEHAARELGMQPMQAAQIDPLKRVVKPSTDKDKVIAKDKVSAKDKVLAKTAPANSPAPATAHNTEVRLLGPAKAR